MKQNTFERTKKINMNITPVKQRGITMIVTLVVLLVLTIIGVSAIDSNNLQSVMTRNNQYRLETFNGSNVEIEAQLTFYTFSAPDGIAQPIVDLLGGDVGASLAFDSSKTPSENTLAERSTNPSFQKEISLKRASGCPVFGSTINTSSGGEIGGSGAKKCSLLQIDSSAGYENPQIKSEQVQTFSILTL